MVIKIMSNAKDTNFFVKNLQTASVASGYWQWRSHEFIFGGAKHKIRQ